MAPGSDHLEDRCGCCNRRRMAETALSHAIRQILRNIRILEQGRHLQNCEAAIAKLRFCASLIVNDTMPIRLPRSSNNPPPDEPADTGALICMYCVLSSEVLRPDRRPEPSVLTRPFGDPIV